MVSCFFVKNIALPSSAKMAQDIVLNFYDSLLRKSDVKLLEKGQWLNDKIIGFMFEYFEYEQFTELDDVLFVNADAAQCIKLCEGTELSIFLEPLQVHSKRMIFSPVNSNKNPASTGGTHWSLLIYDRTMEKFQHYDSASPANSSHALTMSRAFEPFLEAKKKVDFLEAYCPQQINTNDCGMYVICVAEYLCKQQQNSSQKSLDEEVTPAEVQRKRNEVKKIIEHLRENRLDKS